VQFACEATALSLLRVKRTTPARAALVLEAVEHVVERVLQRGHLGHRALHRDPPPRVHRVHTPHQGGQLAQRREHPPQRQHVDHKQRHRARREHRYLRDAGACTDRRGRQHERGKRHTEHSRVDQSHTP
jgi:hypothetical protein